MTPNHSSHEQTLSQFSNSWTIQSRQYIAQIVDSANPIDRPSLAAALIRCDCEKRLERGEQPQREDYLELESFLDSPPLDWNTLSNPTPSSRNSTARVQSVSPPIPDLESSLVTILEGSIPPVDTADKSATPISEQRFAQYELVERLGKGGMGDVWLANQKNHVIRKVALKLAPGSVADPQLRTRFQQEIQALAILNHPNIANIFDAGVTSDGIPFYVMEWVDGKPITQYCNERNLTIRERLVLFLSVCSAVQHAHEQGLVHRDLKPSNILVYFKDGKHVVKVIDFGLVKNFNRDKKLIDNEYQTEFGFILGSIPYMPPEQAESSSSGDHRMDVYSLGAVLYELFTGQTPHASWISRETHLLKQLDIIRTQDPCTPSQQVKRLTANQLQTEARQRNTAPNELTNLLKGELDWIVMRAIEKEAENRYRTVSGLTRDIENHLAGEIVAARAPTFHYRFRKFVKRHSVLLTTTVVISIIAGLFYSGTSWLLEREREKVSLEKERTKQSEERSARFEAESAKQMETVKQKDQRITQSTAHGLILLAMNQWASNQITNANQSLEKVPDGQRGFTWRLAKRMFDASLVTYKFYDNQSVNTNLSHNRRFVAFRNQKSINVVDLKENCSVASIPCGFKTEKIPMSTPLVTNNGQFCVYLEEKKLLIHKIESGNAPIVFSDSADSISRMALNQAETQLAVATISGEVHIFDFPKLCNITPEITGANSSSDGIDLFTSDASVGTYSTPVSSINFVRFCDSDSKLMIANPSKIDVLDLSTHKPIRIIPNPCSFYDQVEYCPTGTLAISVDLNDRITIHNLESGAVSTIASGEGTARTLTVSPNGLWLACVGDDRIVRVFDIDTGTLLRECKGHENRVDSLSFSEDSERLISVTNYGEIKIWPVPFHIGYPLLASMDQEISKMVSPADGKRFYLGSLEGAILVWDREKRQTIATLHHHTGEITALSISQDGTQLASCDSSNTLLLWDLTNHQVINRFKGHVASIAAIALSPNGDRLLSADADGIMRIWDTKSGKIQKTIRADDAAFVDVSYSRDGKSFAATDEIGNLRVWNTQTNKIVFQSEGDIDSFTCIELSPDGKFLFAGGFDGEIYRWNIQDQNRLETINAHVEAIANLAVCEDGKLLMSQSDDGSVHLWNLETGTMELQLAAGRYENDLNTSIVGVAIHSGREEALIFLNSFTGGIDRGSILCWDTNRQASNAHAKSMESDPEFHRLMSFDTYSGNESVPYFGSLFHSAWLLRLEPTAANYVDFHDKYDAWKASQDKNENSYVLLPTVVKEALMMPPPSDLVPLDAALAAAELIWRKALPANVEAQSLRELPESETLRRAADQYDIGAIQAAASILEMRLGNWALAVTRTHRAAYSRDDLLDRQGEILAVAVLSHFKGNNKFDAAIEYGELKDYLSPEELRDNSDLAQLVDEIEKTIPKSDLEDPVPAFRSGGSGGMGGFF